MQSGQDQLLRQQQILMVKGFYNGALDGIWSTKTIAAKKAYERSGKFSPGLPNGGLPWSNSGPYPKGITRNSEGLLTCVEVEDYLANAPETTKVVAVKIDGQFVGNVTVSLDATEEEVAAAVTQDENWASTSSGKTFTRTKYTQDTINFLTN